MLSRSVFVLWQDLHQRSSFASPLICTYVGSHSDNSRANGTTKEWTKELYKIKLIFHTQTIPLTTLNVGPHFPRPCSILSDHLIVFLLTSSLYPWPKTQSQRTRTNPERRRNGPEENILIRRRQHKASTDFITAATF